MRKIIFLMHVSLDGYVAGPNGEMDWIVYNEEIAQYSHDLHPQTDTAIYGRKTYEMMKGYWPTVLTDPDAGPGEIAHARWVEDATKIVVSRTLESSDWKNTVIIRDNLAEEFNRRKAQPGKDMWLLGSATLAQEMMRFNLIDEYRLNINPVVLGKGQALFEGVPDFKLKLIEAQTFKGGVVAARYSREG